MEVISVNITKGGCGKTTTVQILAEILSCDYKKKVLVIDTDPQCNLTTVSGIDLMKCQEHNLYTLLKDESTIDQCIVKAKYYDVVPGSLLLAYADTEFNQATMIGRERYLRNKIEDLNYDYILIDTPPALGILNIMSLTASTKVIIPTECSYLAMIGLDQLYNTIESVKKHSNNDLEISGILLIKYNNRTNLNAVVLNGLMSMSQKMNTKVFNSKIRETVKIREAQSLKEPLLNWNDTCSAIQDYRAFVGELVI